jgi:hypothetical protein
MKLKKSRILLAKTIRKATGCSFISAHTAVRRSKPWYQDVWSVAVGMESHDVAFPDLWVETEWTRTGASDPTGPTEVLTPVALVGPTGRYEFSP